MRVSSHRQLSSVHPRSYPGPKARTMLRPFDFVNVSPGAQLATRLNGGTVALKEIVDLAALGRIVPRGSLCPYRG